MTLAELLHGAEKSTRPAERRQQVMGFAALRAEDRLAPPGAGNAG